MLRIRDRWAENWLKLKSADLLRPFRGLMLPESQAVLSRGLAEGKNPRSVGLDLAGRINPATGKREHGLVQLDAREKAKVEEFRQCIAQLDQKFFTFEMRDRRLDKSFRVALRDRKPVQAVRIELHITRFENKMLKHKADTIAITAMMSAMARSEFFGSKESLEKSNLPEEACSRVWESANDDRVRPSHRALDGQLIVGFTKPFVSPLTGTRMNFPGDTSLGAPNEETQGCRCRVRYDIDFFYNIL